MIAMRPKDAIELKDVPLVESYPPEDTCTLPEDRLYLYLLQPGKEHNDQYKRAADRIWSEATYRLSEVVLSPGKSSNVLLMLIPQDTELPPDFVQKGENVPTS